MGTEDPKPKTAVGKAPFPWRLLAFALVFVLISAGLGYYSWNLRGDFRSGQGELKMARLEAARGREAQKEITLLKGSLGDCNESGEAEVLRCQQVEKSLKAMQQDLSATRDELDTLRQQREETEKELGAFKELTAKFQKMIDGGKLNVAIRNGRMIVKLPAGVLFQSGQAALSRDGELALMEVAIVLRTLSERKFMVAGHTDNRPLENASETSRYRNNWELSTARAVTVTEFLIEARMNPSNLVAAGYGQFDPVGDNETPKGRQENRRIEIVLLPNLEKLQTPSAPEPTPAPAEQ